MIKGKLDKVNLSGEIRAVPSKSADIKQHRFSSRVAQRGPKYAAKWSGGISFSGVANKLFIVLRFLAAKSRIGIKRQAKANAAPTVDIEAESHIQASVDAPASAHPALEITVDSKPVVSVKAFLQAYIREPLKFIKGIALSHFVQPVAAPGVLGKFIRAVKLGRVAKAEAAKGAILESRYNVQNVGVAADADTAPGVTAPAFAEVLDVGLTANAGAASVQSLTVERMVAVAVHAGLYCWCLPEVTDDTLTIYQVFSGIQEGESVSVDVEDESAYWANATVSGDVLNLVFANTDADGLELI